MSPPTSRARRAYPVSSTWRVARGGEMLTPDRPDLPIQALDARDLAGWVLRIGRSGPYRPSHLTLEREAELLREWRSPVRPFDDPPAG